MDGVAYHVLPTFLVRLAGFSYSRLRPLRFPLTLEAITVSDAAEETLRVAALSAAAAVRAQHPAGNDRQDSASDRRRWRRVREALQELVGNPGAPFTAGALQWASEREPGLAGTLAEVCRCAQERDTAHGRRRACFAGELDEARHALRDAFRDTGLLEAVFLESPAAFEGVLRLDDDGEMSPARRRARERTAALYLQRFCAKNDTNSICGPVAVSRFVDGGLPPQLSVSAAAVTRRTYFSHWAAERLHVAVTRQAGVGTVLRRNPATRCHPSAANGTLRVEWLVLTHDRGGRQYLRSQRSAVVSDAVAQALRLLARPLPRSVAVEALVSAAGLEASAAAELVDELLAAGLLLAGPVLPVGTFDPLAAVTALAADWPQHNGNGTLLAAVATLRDATTEFATVPLPQRRRLAAEIDAAFVAATGENSSRGHGEHYADRWLLHEDCHAALVGEFGHDAMRAHLPKLGLLLDLCALPLELRRANVRAWYRERFGPRARRSLLEVHRAFDREQPVAAPPRDAEAAALAAAIARVRLVLGEAVAGAHEGIARLLPADLAAALPPSPQRRRAAYASADLMVARQPSGECQWVVGEMHGIFLLPTFWFDVAAPATRDRALAEMKAALEQLAGGRVTAEALLIHTQATDRRFPLGAVDLMVVGPSDREGALELGELDVELGEEGFRFLAGEREVAPFLAFGAYPFLSYTSPLAPLIDDVGDRFFPSALLPAEMGGGDAPRLTLDDVVFRRRTWTRTAGELAAALGEAAEDALLARAQALRRRLGAPPEVFVTLSGEPKPLLLDFASYFLVEAVARLLRREPAESRVCMSEMLPAPAELWLEGGDGRRTFELRVGIYRGG